MLQFQPILGDPLIHIIFLIYKVFSIASNIHVKTPQKLPCNQLVNELATLQEFSRKALEQFSPNKKLHCWSDSNHAIKYHSLKISFITIKKSRVTLDTFSHKPFSLEKAKISLKTLKHFGRKKVVENHSENKLFFERI